MNIEQFIEQDIDLVDSNDFTELYNRCKFFDRHQLTDALYACDIDPLVHMTDIPEWFAYQSNLTSIVIPHTMVSIGTEAFYSCTKLTSISIASSVTSIGNRAFRWCENLTHITIPNSITSIGKNAFERCGHIQTTFLGTKQEWKHLVTGKKIFLGTTYVCNCTDGVVKK